MRYVLLDLAYIFCLIALLSSLHQLGLAVLGTYGRRWLWKAPHMSPQMRFAIIVPAHNEGSQLLPTLASLAAVNYPPNLLCTIVVADNSTDDTAKVASAAGVEVWVRDQPEARGKGQALAWSFLRLEKHRFDAVAIIDADSTADPNLFLRFNDAMLHDQGADRTCTRLSVYQARYEFAENRNSPTWLQAIGIAAKASENSFIYRPRSILNWTNLLQGNGFCLPLEVLEKVPWKAGSIVEDAEYALDLCLADIRVQYLDDALVVSRLPQKTADSAVQRIRWAKGMFRLSARNVPRLLYRSVKDVRVQFAEAAFMLCFISRVTPLYAGLGGLAATLFAPAHERAGPLAMLTATAVCQLLFGCMMVATQGENPTSMKSLWLLPRYATHILFAQTRALMSLRKTVWTRTNR